MKTLQDFEIEIMRVREAINDMSIKGNRNASLLVYAVDKCNTMIDEIRELSNPKGQSQNGAEKEVNADAEQ